MRAAKLWQGIDMERKLASRIFAVAVLALAAATLILTGISLQAVTGANIPDPPVVIAFPFVLIGLVLEILRPKTEWHMQRKMRLLAAVSIIVAVWTIFDFGILQGRFPGGPNNPFDQHFERVVPVYTIFKGTFFFGFFFPVYFLFKPSANTIVGATIYNLSCLILVPIGTAAGAFAWPPYLEDYIMEVIGLVMFWHWYKNTPKDGRKFLGMNSLRLVVVVSVVSAIVLAGLVLAGILTVPSGVL